MAIAGSQIVAGGALAPLAPTAVRFLRTITDGILPDLGGYRAQAS
jgi:hypothetical protein